MTTAQRAAELFDFERSKQCTNTNSSNFLVLHEEFVNIIKSNISNLTEHFRQIFTIIKNKSLQDYVNKNKKTVFKQIKNYLITSKTNEIIDNISELLDKFDNEEKPRWQYGGGILTKILVCVAILAPCSIGFLIDLGLNLAGISDPAIFMRVMCFLSFLRDDDDDDTPIITESPCQYHGDGGKKNV